MVVTGCVDPPPPDGTTVSSLEIGEVGLTVWVADTPEERARGLSGVERLPDDIDGMLFVFEEPTIRTFHMLETVIPLDIWWFDADGILLGSTTMEPCPVAPCPGYESPGLVTWALETPQGVVELVAGAFLTLDNG